MGVTRRGFMSQGTAAAAAGLLGAVAARGDEAQPATVVGACGLACSTCPLMAAKKCKGCASGKAASEAMVKAKGCPVLSCAAMKKIDYCGTGCKKFTECAKLIGRPYDKTFIAMMKKKMA